MVYFYMNIEDLLELANLSYPRARNLTGKRYTLNVRKDWRTYLEKT